MKKLLIGVLAALLITAPSLAAVPQQLTPGQPLPSVATTAAASSLVVRAAPGSMSTFSGYTAATTGWFLVFDATACPADGAGKTPIAFFPYTTAATRLDFSWGSAPLAGLTGIVVCFSTTGPYTLTASATASMSAQGHP